jgi:hypothetical protein
MPPGNRNLNISDQDYIALVSYILQSNAFPPHRDDNPLTASLLEELVVPSRTGEKTVGPPNFALVQVVGCLAPGPNNKGWVLTQTSEPVVTKDEAPTANLLKTAATRPLGDQTYQLVSVTPFKPEAHKGHKVEARGLLYRDPTDARLNLTSLQMVGESCPN